jgi:hypothetical protein
METLIVGIIILILIAVSILFRYRRSRALSPIVSKIAPAREWYQHLRRRRGSDGMDEPLIEAMAEDMREGGAGSPKPPPYGNSLTKPAPAFHHSASSLFGEQTSPSSGTFTPITSWGPGAQLHPPPKVRYGPSAPAVMEHIRASPTPLVAVIDDPSHSGVSFPDKSARISAQPITPSSTCPAQAPRLADATPLDLTLAQLCKQELADADTGGRADRRTNHSGWSAWFRHDDSAEHERAHQRSSSGSIGGAEHEKAHQRSSTGSIGGAEHEKAHQRSSTGSIGGVSVASSAVLSVSLLSFPMPPPTPTSSVARASTGSSSTASGLAKGRNLIEAHRQPTATSNGTAGLLSPFGASDS